MISSGIKRGLAASAVSALAVAGLPLLASSASATAGDSIAVASVGPVLNGGDQGGVVVLKTKGITAANLKLIGSDLTSSANNPTQSVSIVSRSVAAEGTANDSNKTDGLDEITLHIKATTANAGDVAKFAVYEDEFVAPATAGNDAVDAGEARQQVSMTTSGPVATIGVSPASQSVASGIESGDYTVSLKDAAGRATQLATTDAITVVGGGDVVTSDGSLDSTETELGTDTFTAHGTAVKANDITLTDTATPTVKNKATLNVTPAATIDADEADIVTGADTWDGFDGGTTPGTTDVGVGQSSIRVDFKSLDVANDKNSTVTLNVSSANVTFGGKDTTTVSTMLDGNGVGSITITPDAGTIQNGDSIDIAGTFAQTIDFVRAETQVVKATANPYFSKFGGSVDVTANVVDQFGNPVTTGFVEAKRSGVNNDATAQRKAVGNDGKVTFTFTDTKATAPSSDTVNFAYFVDQFDNAPTAGTPTTIKYTADGMGNDFKTSLEGKDTELATYKASDVSVVPLTDTVVSAADEAADLIVTNGEAGSQMTVSVDNGALILAPGKTALSDGKTSVTDAVANFAAGSPNQYQIIGTKSGVVTVTVTSVGRTETSQFTVGNDTVWSNERNVAVSGPAEVEHGANQIAYTAVVTDAFGNPIAGIDASSLNIQVTGPAQFQDSDAMTNAAGQLHLNVRVDSDAAGQVGIRVQGLYGQMGAAANRLDTSSTSDDAKGLSASSNIANAATTVKAKDLEPIVATMAGQSNAGKADVLKVSAPSTASGAVVKLFKVVNGMRKLVKSSTLNASGDRTFTVADTNGKGYTKYVAVVSPTVPARTKGDTTNSKTVR